MLTGVIGAGIDACTAGLDALISAMDSLAIEAKPVDDIIMADDDVSFSAVSALDEEGEVRAGEEEYKNGGSRIKKGSRQSFYPPNGFRETVNKSTALRQHRITTAHPEKCTRETTSEKQKIIQYVNVPGIYQIVIPCAFTY